MTIDILITSDGKEINISDKNLTSDDFLTHSRIDGIIIDEDDFITTIISPEKTAVITLVPNTVSEQIGEELDLGMSSNELIININKAIKKGNGHHMITVGDTDSVNIKDQIRRALNLQLVTFLKYHSEIFWLLPISGHTKKEAKEILEELIEEDKEASTIHLIDKYVVKKVD